MNFYENALELVKAAYTKYLLEEVEDDFRARLHGEDTTIYLFDSVLLGHCETLEEKYRYTPQGDNVCLVIGEVVINNELKDILTERRTKITVLCFNSPDGIRFECVHASASRMRLVDEKQRMERELQYRAVMEHMCDLLLELDVDLNTFYCDEARYEAFFKEKTQCGNVDDWFWHLCNNFVWAQDSENLDIFRPNDIAKRLKNKDYIYDTKFRMHRVDNDCVWVHMRVAFIPAINDASISKIYLLLEDITIEMNEKLRNVEFARRDSLTKLWNRRYTNELIEEAIKTRGSGIFILVDVDRFKAVNDTYGHITGDHLLTRISSNMQDKLNDGDVLGRLGGDEFVVFISSTGDEDRDRRHVMDIVEATRFHYTEDGLDMPIHCSAGAVIFNNSEITFEALYEAADKVMYQAKEAGRDKTNIVCL